jgi:hypothetical protein
MLAPAPRVKKKLRLDGSVQRLLGLLRHYDKLKLIGHLSVLRFDFAGKLLAQIISDARDLPTTYEKDHSFPRRGTKTPVCDSIAATD